RSGRHRRLCPLSQVVAAQQSEGRSLRDLFGWPSSLPSRVQNKLPRRSGQLLGRKRRTANGEADACTASRAYRLYEGPVLSTTRLVWRRGQELDTRERSPAGGGAEVVWEELRATYV